MANSVYIGWLGPTQSSGSGGGTTFGGSLIPAADNAYDLGTALLQWRTLYLGTSAILADAGTLQFGTTTPAVLSRGAANRLDLAAGDSFYVPSGGVGIGATPPAAGSLTVNLTVTADKFDITGGGSFSVNNPFVIQTAPTVTSAGTSPGVTFNNGSVAFRVDVGTGGTATTIVMAMPAASNGWNCFAENITATAANRGNQRVVFQSSTTTSLTVQNQTISTGAALAFTAGDIVSFICFAF